jgi:hypothetical protein
LLHAACDSARSVEALAALASTACGRPVQNAEVRDRLAPYIERGLLLEQEGHLLALAVAARRTGGRPAGRGRASRRARHPSLATA